MAIGVDNFPREWLVAVERVSPSDFMGLLGFAFE